jgi:hypothetical protein
MLIRKVGFSRKKQAEIYVTHTPRPDAIFGKITVPQSLQIIAGLEVINPEDIQFPATGRPVAKA